MHAAFAYLFPNICISYDEVDHKTGVQENAVDQPMPISRKEFLERWEHVALDHPSVRYLTNGGTEPVFQLNDFVSEREFYETSLYREFWRLLGINHQMNALLLTPTRFAGVAVNRDTVFTKEEIQLMELMQPHFVQAYHTARLLSGVASAPPVLDFEAWRSYGFTRRECEVLQWLVEGKRNCEIAIILGVSPLTVKKHLEHIFVRLRVETRAAAAVRAREILSSGSYASARPERPC